MSHLGNDLYVKTMAGEPGADERLALHLYKYSAIWIISKFHIKDELRLKELTQECVIHIFKKLDRFHNRGPFDAWAHTLTVNKVRELFRRQMRRADREQSMEDLETIKELDAVTSKQASESMRLRAMHHHDVLAVLAVASAAAATLPNKRYRLVYELRVLQGMEIEELARVLGLSAPQASTLTHRALRAVIDKVKCKLL